MGDGIVIKCSSCEFQDEYFSGVGMNYYSLENVIDLVHWRKREKVKEILGTHEVDAVDFEHVLFCCPGCHFIFSRFWVAIEYDQGKIYESQFKCPKCKKTLKKLIQPIEECACKRCGKYAVKQTEAFHWD